MKATQLLHNLGQSLWLDNITRDLINGGTLKRYVDELSVTGLTSNPTISERFPRQREIIDIMSADGGDCDTVSDQFATARH
jgi:transaldolase